jgi:iron complex outermembrane receptor protein
MFKPNAFLTARRISIFSLAIAVALPALTPGVALAQGADEAIEEVTAYGVRRSLDNAADLKRNSDTIVDAITAEDIGLFSDNNIAEALQRVPGVQLERSDNEGNRISIRGLGPRFVRTTLNGRTALSSPGGENGTDARGFSFGLIPSEVITKATVHKSSQAMDVEGAIGGAVNLETTRPLDFAIDQQMDFYVGGAARGTFNDLEDQNSSRGSLFLNKKFNDQFGVFFATSIDRRDFVSHHVETQDLDTSDFRIDGQILDDDGITVIREATILNGREMTEAYCVELGLRWRGGSNSNCDFTQAALFDGYRNQYTANERDRNTYTGGLQWQPTDQLEIYVDWTHADEDRYDQTYRDRRRAYYALDDLDRSDTPTTITDINIALDDANEFSDGVVTSYSFLNHTRRDRNRGKVFNGNLVNWRDGDIDVGGINLKWSNDDWTIAGDFGYASQEQVRLQWSLAGELDYTEDGRFPNYPRSEPDNVEDYGINGFFDISSGIPIVHFEDVNGEPVDATTLDDIIFWNDRQQLYLEDNEEKSFRLDFENELDDRDDGDLISFFNNIKFGVVYREREGSRTLLRTEAWAPDNNERVEEWEEPFAGVPLAPYGAITVDGFMSDITVPGFNNTFAVHDIFAWAEADVTGTFGKDPYDGIVRQDQNYTVYEDITAAYVQLGFSGGDSVPYRGNIVLRYADTEQSSTGFVGFYEDADGSTQEQFFPLDPNNPIRTSLREYDDWLPSANIAFDFTDTMVFRLAYSKTVARPDPVDLRQAIELDEDIEDAASPDPDDYEGERDGESGNPDLDPYRTDNYDMSLEFYPEAGGAYAIGLFYKKLDGFIAPGQEPVDFDLSTQIPGAPVITYDISRPVNTDGGVVQGAELSMHLPFDTFTDGLFSGFGITSSVTYVDAELDAVRDFGQPVSLRGTSEWSGNIVTYYENGPFGIRLAYNYRDDFLHQEGEAPDDYDEYTTGDEYVDLNVDYRINDNWRIRLTGNNLTDTQRYRVYRGAANDYLNGLRDDGRTYVLEVRGSLGND